MQRDHQLTINDDSSTEFSDTTGFSATPISARNRGRSLRRVPWAVHRTLVRDSHRALDTLVTATYISRCSDSIPSPSMSRTSGDEPSFRPATGHGAELQSPSRVRPREFLASALFHGPVISRRFNAAQSAAILTAGYRETATKSRGSHRSDSRSQRVRGPLVQPSLVNRLCEPGRDGIARRSQNVILSLAAVIPSSVA